MRKIIIDTDTGSDDAAALLLAASRKDISVLGVTTVAGNVPLDKATANALMTLEVCGAPWKVYPGCDRPLLHPLETADGVHGADGMGDVGLIHPARTPEALHAVEFILDMARAYPGELEIVALGPATNLALAILRDREAMAGVKHIWSMGTAGYGPGNTTPVAEFNVFVDAEAYAILLESGIPLTVAGFDLCVGEAALREKELEKMAVGGTVSRFAWASTTRARQHNLELRGELMSDLPDAVAMAIAFWPEVVTDWADCFCHCCAEVGHTYGQVLFYEAGRSYYTRVPLGRPNGRLIKAVDGEAFKAIYLDALEKLDQACE